MTAAPTARGQSSTQCWHARHLAKGWFATNWTRRATTRPAGRISNGTAGSGSTSKAAAASAATLPPEHPDKLEDLKALWVERGAEVQRAAVAP